MSAAPQATTTARGELARRSWRWPLLTQPRVHIAYICTVVACYAGAIGAFAATTPIRPAQLGLWAALVLCGGVCIEITHRLGMPAGMSRDMLSAWWLPIALLLPPLYALLAPIPLYVLLQTRVRQTMVHRRVFNTAVIGLAGAAAGVLFQSLVPASADGAAGWLAQGRLGIVAAVGCGVLFTVLNSAALAVAVRTSDPEPRWRELLWNAERLLLDTVEVCVGVLVAIATAVAPPLLLIALPPVALLQRSLLHAQLKAAARTDAKTGLLNAAAWQREATTEIARARRTGEPMALLILDIDHFKRVNDTHGHLLGDQVLVAVANTLCGQVRAYDIIGRFGGEEFVILLPRTDLVEACRVGERLRVRISRTAVPADAGGMVSVSVSVGVALLRVHGHDLIELLAAADLALYRAKELGRDRVCLPANGNGRGVSGNGQAKSHVDGWRTAAPLEPRKAEPAE